MKNRKRKAKLKLYRVIKIFVILVLLFASYMLGFARGLDNLPDTPEVTQQYIH